MILLGALVQQQNGDIVFVRDDTYLTFHADAGDPASYAGGASWTDLVNSYVATLYNTPTQYDLYPSIGFNNVQSEYGHWNYAANLPQLNPGFSGTIEVVFKGGFPSSSLVTMERHAINQAFGTFGVTGTQMYLGVASHTAPPYTYYAYSGAHVLSGWNYAALSVDIPSSTGNMDARFLVNGTFTNDTPALTVAQPTINGAMETGRSRNYTYATTYSAQRIAVIRAYSQRLSDAQMLNNYQYYKALYSPDTLIWDSFTDTNGVFLPAHTMDQGPGWSNVVQISSGTPGNYTNIQSNEVQITADTSGVITESGISDCLVELDWKSTTGSFQRNSIYGRYSSAGNMIMLNFRNDTSDDITLYRGQADAYTIIGGPVAFTWTAGQYYKLSLRMEGTNIRCYIDDVLMIEVTEGFNETATQHGFGRNAGASDCRIDNFRIVPI